MYFDQPIELRLWHTMLAAGSFTHGIIKPHLLLESKVNILPQ